MDRGVSPKMRETVTSALVDLILTVADFGGQPVPGQVRGLRIMALELLKVAAQGNLSPHFKDHALEYLDLYGMNFESLRLNGISFKGCFLLEADFRHSTLIEASFAGASLRNVNFAEANLSDADLTDADWFNALGFTESQLKAVRQETLMACPADVDAMHCYLENHYVVPFSAWPTRIQEQLETAWSEYLRPQGLRDRFAKRRNAQ